jgi:hypothetical protein
LIIWLREPILSKSSAQPGRDFSVEQWLVFANGKVVGPIDAALVVRGIVDGTVPRGSRVRRATKADSDWVGIDEVEEFANAFEATIVRPTPLADADDFEATVLREPVAPEAPSAGSVVSGPGSEHENEREAVWMMLVDDELRGPVSLADLRRTAPALAPGLLVRRLKTAAWCPIASVLGAPGTGSPLLRTAGPNPPAPLGAFRSATPASGASRSEAPPPRSARSRLLLMASAAAIVIVVAALAFFVIRPSKGRRLIEEARIAREDGRIDDAITILASVEDASPGRPEVEEARRLAATWLIDEARRRHAAGKLDGALDLLRRVRPDGADGSPASDAPGLAVGWVAESVDRGDGDLGRRRRLLDRLLAQFDANSGAAMARICVLYAEAKDYDALRRCLDTDLKGKSVAPAEIVEKARAVLLAHDQDVERSSLLASVDEADWQSLADKYPKSIEAKNALDKLRRAHSLCADLKSWMDDVETEAGEVANVQVRYRTENRTHRGESPLDFFKRLGSFQKDSTARAASVRKRLEKLKLHKSMPGESPIRDDTGKLYETFAEAYDKYAELFGLGTRGFAGLVGVNNLVEDFPTIVKAARGELERRCSALPASGDDGVPTASAVTSAPTTKTRYVTTVCPDGRWALGSSGSVPCLCHNPDDVTSRGDPFAPTPAGKCEVVGSDGSNCKWKCE